MAEQTSLRDDRYWFSLVTAAPIAELPERAAVAVIFGNGRVIGMRHETDLPRLSGIAPIDTRRTFGAILSYVAHDVLRGHATLESVMECLGPQFRADEPRVLHRELTDDVMNTITRAMLRQPGPPAVSDHAEAVVRLSRRMLRHQIAAARFQQEMVSHQVHARDLYESIRDTIPQSTPRLAAAVRGFHGRDVLLDSVAFHNRLDPSKMREHAARISHAFFELRNRVRPLLEKREGRSFRLVGVVQRADEDASADVREVRAFAVDSMRPYADVLVDASTSDPVAALNDAADWVGGG